MIFVASYITDENRTHSIGASDSLGTLLGIVNREINGLDSGMDDSTHIYFEAFGPCGHVIGRSIVTPVVDDSIDPDEICGQNAYHSLDFGEVMASLIGAGGQNEA